MTVILSDETRKLIEDQIKRGAYASVDEVVLAGLASLRQQETVGEFAPGEMDALLAQGERGGQSLDGQSVLAELANPRARQSNEIE